MTDHAKGWPSGGPRIRKRGVSFGPCPDFDTYISDPASRPTCHEIIEHRHDYACGRCNYKWHTWSDSNEPEAKPGCPACNRKGELLRRLDRLETRFRDRVWDGFERMQSDLGADVVMPNSHRAVWAARRRAFWRGMLLVGHKLFDTPKGDLDGLAKVKADLDRLTAEVDGFESQQVEYAAQYKAQQHKGNNDDRA